MPLMGLGSLGKVYSAKGKIKRSKGSSQGKEIKKFIGKLQYEVVRHMPHDK